MTRRIRLPRQIRWVTNAGPGIVVVFKYPYELLLNNEKIISTQEWNKLSKEYLNNRKIPTMTG